jgi:hypothetical protein
VRAAPAKKSDANTRLVATRPARHALRGGLAGYSQDLLPPMTVAPLDRLYLKSATATEFSHHRAPLTRLWTP